MYTYGNYTEPSRQKSLRQSIFFSCANETAATTTIPLEPVLVDQLACKTVAENIG